MTKENIDKHISNWPRIPDHPYRILTTGGFVSGKTDALLNMMKQQHDDDYSIIDKFIQMLRIHVKQNMNILLKIVKKSSWKCEWSNDFYWIFKKYTRCL